MAQSSRQDILKRWLEARTANQELQALGLEQKHPWLLAIKEIVGIKDPEGPKAAKVPRTAVLLEVPPHQEKAVKKHLTSPLMLKAKTQTLDKFKRFH
jgi:hypothetical protein